MQRITLAIAVIVILSMTARQSCGAPEDESLLADKLDSKSVAPQHILVRIQMLEVSRKKLDGLNIEHATAGDTDGIGEIIKQRVSSNGDTIDVEVFRKTEVVRKLIATLQKHEIAKIVANPTLMVANGTRAALNCNDNYELPATSELGKPVQYQTFGTRLDILATAQANKSIRLELGVQRAEPDYSTAVVIGSNKIPVRKVSHLDTAFDLTAGQSGFLICPPSDRSQSKRDGVTKANNKDGVETWLIVTPELQPSIASFQKTVR